MIAISWFYNVVAFELDMLHWFVQICIYALDLLKIHGAFLFLTRRRKKSNWWFWRCLEDAHGSDSVWLCGRWGSCKHTHKLVWKKFIKAKTKIKTLYKYTEFIMFPSSSSVLYLVPTMCLVILKQFWLYFAKDWSRQNVKMRIYLWIEFIVYSQWIVCTCS